MIMFRFCLIFLVLSFGLVTLSCGTSHEFSSGLIQKRKYNSWFYFNSKGNYGIASNEVKNKATEGYTEDKKLNLSLVEQTKNDTGLTRLDNLVIYPKDNSDVSRNCTSDILVKSPITVKNAEKLKYNTLSEVKLDNNFTSISISVVDSNKEKRNSKSIIALIIMLIAIIFILLGIKIDVLLGFGLILVLLAFILSLIGFLESKDTTDLVYKISRKIFIINSIIVLSLTILILVLFNSFNNTGIHFTNIKL